MLGIYLVVLSGIAVAASTRRARFQGGVIGSAVFEFAYFVLVLRGGFGVESLSEAQEFVRHIYIGLALLPVAFFWSQLCTMLVAANKAKAQNDQLP